MVCRCCGETFCKLEEAIREHHRVLRMRLWELRRLVAAGLIRKEDCERLLRTPPGVLVPVEVPNDP